jgi:hypothetical protein
MFIVVLAIRKKYSKNKKANKSSKNRKLNVKKRMKGGELITIVSACTFTAFCLLVYYCKDKRKEGNPLACKVYHTINAFINVH